MYLELKKEQGQLEERTKENEEERKDEQRHADGIPEVRKRSEGGEKSAIALEMEMRGPENSHLVDNVVEVSLEVTVRSQRLCDVTCSTVLGVHLNGREVEDVLCWSRERKSERKRRRISLGSSRVESRREEKGKERRTDLG